MKCVDNRSAGAEQQDLWKDKTSLAIQKEMQLMATTGYIQKFRPSLAFAMSCGWSYHACWWEDHITTLRTCWCSSLERSNDNLCRWVLWCLWTIEGINWPLVSKFWRERHKPLRADFTQHLTGFYRPSKRCPQAYTARNRWQSRGKGGYNRGDINIRCSDRFERTVVV